VSPAPRLVEVHELPAPAGSRITGQVDPTAGDDWLPDAERRLAESAAVLLDYSQGGIYWNAAYQDRVAELARRTGALWVADETVTGFGRVGGWFQYQHADSRPDLVTMGKSLAAGGAPAGAVVLSAELLERMAGSSWQSYSTFRGHPVEVAAIVAHIQASAAERIHERAAQLDGVMLERLTRMAADHPSIARIDGRGLHWTVELHGPDWREWRGEDADPIASQVAARAFQDGALIATSGEQTSLFLAPPLVISEADLGELLDVLDGALRVSDEAFERSRA
jgi:4-aminobutyrate aminotransferase-like enzyme